MWSYIVIWSPITPYRGATYLKTDFFPCTDFNFDKRHDPDVRMWVCPVVLG